jgi:hypothetical protein
MNRKLMTMQLAAALLAGTVAASFAANPVGHRIAPAAPVTRAQPNPSVPHAAAPKALPSTTGSAPAGTAVVPPIRSSVSGCGGTQPGLSKPAGSPPGC